MIKTKEDKIAYTQVYEILKNLSENDLKKIPTSLMINLKENIDENYIFVFNINDPINSSNITKKARLMLAVIYRDYLATEIQRNKIFAYEKHKKVEEEELLRQKYNPDEIFKRKNVNKENLDSENLVTEQSISVIENENWIKKIINKILNIFRKGKNIAKEK